MVLHYSAELVGVFVNLFLNKEYPFKELLNYICLDTLANYHPSERLPYLHVHPMEVHIAMPLPLLSPWKLYFHKNSMTCHRWPPKTSFKTL